MMFPSFTIRCGGRGSHWLSRKDSVLPDCCVKCAAPAEGQTVDKWLFWHTPILLPVALLSWPFYLLLYWYAENDDRLDPTLFKALGFSDMVYRTRRRNVARWLYLCVCGFNAVDTTLDAGRHVIGYRLCSYHWVGS